MNKKSIFIQRPFAIFLLLAVILTAGLLLVTSENQIRGQAKASAPDQLDRKVEAFISRLENEGYTSMEGEIKQFPLDKLCLMPGSPLDCLYLNAASPYLAAFVPMDLGETEIWGYSGVVNSPLWRLRPDEAVVLIGETPPPMRYFGFMGYVVKRYYPADDQGAAGYRTYFNNFGEQVNNLTINSAGTPNGSPGDPFNSLFVYILTPDRETDAQVREAASKAGFAPPIINTEPMPQSLLQLGLEPDKDLFGLTLRTAHPVNEQELVDWKANPPLRIFRITPNTEPPEVLSSDPFPIPGFRPQSSGQTEFGLVPAVEDLGQAIVDTYSAPNLTVEEFIGQVGFFYGGMHCLEWDINCLGPSPNALYLWFKDGLGILGPDDFIIAYGVNHRLTGQVSYMSISMYGMTKHITNDSVDSAGGDGDQLVGTALQYLPADHPGVDLLYAYKFARSCGGEANCFEVPADWPGVKPDEMATLIWRAYLNPITRTGPDPAEVIFDRAIKFSAAP